MALSKIKTNIQKWETKDEIQTNSSYTVRQIIIKIMEYTHVHIHTWAKLKQSNRNKVQLIDPENKGKKKLYLPVKNKTNKHKLENKTKARWQVGNKVKKTKLANMLRGKEIKKRKKDYKGKVK